MWKVNLFLFLFIFVSALATSITQTSNIGHTHHLDLPPALNSHSKGKHLRFKRLQTREKVLIKKSLFSILQGVESQLGRLLRVEKNKGGLGEVNGIIRKMTDSIKLIDSHPASTKVDSKTNSAPSISSIAKKTASIIVAIVKSLESSATPTSQITFSDFDSTLAVVQMDENLSDLILATEGVVPGVSKILDKLLAPSIPKILETFGLGNLASTLGV